MERRGQIQKETAMRCRRPRSLGDPYISDLSGDDQQWDSQVKSKLGKESSSIRSLCISDAGKQPAEICRPADQGPKL